MRVSVEAVRGYIEMAKQDFGVKASKDMAEVLNRLASMVHPLVLGSIFRITKIARSGVRHRRPRWYANTNLK